MIMAYSKYIAALSALLISSTNLYAFSLPGITPSGLPHVVTEVSVDYDATNLRLRVWAYNTDFDLFDGVSNFAGTRGTTKLNAYFSGSGLFESGTSSIVGVIPALGISKRSLVVADLTAANTTTESFLWGFNTTNTWCAPEIQIGFDCTDNGSIYVSLDDAFDGNFSNSFSTTGTYVQTVGDIEVIPIPATFWLFGSALGLLGWIRRKHISA
jgi:hypothetical protein